MAPSPQPITAQDRDDFRNERGKIQYPAKCKILDYQITWPAVPLCTRYLIGKIALRVPLKYWNGIDIV